MKVVYINQATPVKKQTKNEEKASSAELLASQLRGTGRRKAERILQIELNEK